MKKNYFNLLTAAFVLCLGTTKVSAQLTEGFEGGVVPPTGWTSFLGTNGLGTGFNWEPSTASAHSGTTSAYVRYEASGGVNEDWLVSPQITVPLTATTLSYWDRESYTQDYFTQYSVRVSTTSQTTHASFTSVSTYAEDATTPTTWKNKTIDLSAYAGQSVYIAFVMTQDDGDNWFLDDIAFISNCSGTPAAGSISGTPSSVCSNAAYLLSLTGIGNDVGLSYQWMSSTDGLNFNPIAGATGTTLIDSTTVVPIYYQAVATCANGGATATTSTVSITSITPSNLCYCAPVHIDCAGADFISSTSISSTTLNNTDSLCSTNANGAYSSYPASGNTTASLMQGSTYSLNVTTQEDNIVSCWIDFDQNGSFDPSEWTQVCTTSAANTPNTVSIAVPMTATLGLTGMRIRSRFSGNTNDDASACIFMGSGECEDYFVTITPFVVGVKENTTPQFNIFPNPAKNNVTVKISKEQIGSTITVIDMLGNKVAVVMNTKNNEVNLNLETLSNGVYFICIENEKGSTTNKLVISK